MSFDAGTACLASGTYSGGNKSEDQFEALFPTYALLGKSDEGTKLAGLVTATGGSSLEDGTSGQISWAPPSGYSSFAMLFKFGRGNISDAWFSFAIPTIAFASSSWSLLDGNGDAYTQHGLSHVSLYGVKGGDNNPTPTPVPLPAAGWLLLAALTGLGVYNRKRRV